MGWLGFGTVVLGIGLTLAFPASHIDGLIFLGIGLCVGSLMR